MATETIFILAEEMRVSRSPFYAEGTDLNYDIPTEYPIPHECQILKEGMPVELRFLPNSKTIDKQKQIKNENRKEEIAIDDNGQKKLTFLHGRLVLHNEKDKMAIEYLKSAGWLKTNATVRADGTKIIYEIYDEEAILKADLENEELKMSAMQAVFAMKPEMVDNMFILATSGTVASIAEITLSKKKMHLANVAARNPKFIIEGVQGVRKEAMINVQKAMDKKLIDFSVTDFVSILNATNANQYDPFVEISDTGGQDVKIDRFIDYLLSDEGSKFYSILTARMEEAGIIKKGK